MKAGYRSINPITYILGSRGLRPNLRRALALTIENPPRANLGCNTRITYRRNLRWRQRDDRARHTQVFSFYLIHTDQMNACLITLDMIRYISNK